MTRTEPVAAPSSARRAAGRNPALGWALVALSALAMVAVSPQWLRWWWLLPVALVPMIVAQYRLLSRRAGALAVGVVGLAYVTGLGLDIGGLIPGWAAVLIGLLGGGLFWLLGSIDRPFAERTGYRWFAVQMPVAWVGMDVLLGWSPLIASETWLAYDLAPAPALLQPVSVLGTPMLSFVLLMVNYGLAAGAITALDHRRPPLDSMAMSPRTGLVTCAVGVGVGLAWVLASLVLLGAVRAGLGAPVRVAVIQPGVDPTTVPPGSMPARGPSPLRARMTAATRAAAERGAVLVVWPELIVAGDPGRAGDSWVRDVARDSQVWLVTGFSGPTGADPPNTAVLIGPDGTVHGYYNKQLPVWLEGEVFDQQSLWSAWPTPFGTVGATICWDNQVPRVPREVAAAGARLIATPTLVPPNMGTRQDDHVVFRAVENRVAFARSDWGWSSAIIAADGTVVAEAAWSRDPSVAVVVADVAPGPGGAPFTSWGWAVMWLFPLGLAVRLAAQWRTSPRRRRGSDGSAAPGAPERTAAP